VLLIQHPRKGIGENLGIWLIGFELDKRPQFRLPGRTVTLSRTADFPGNEANSVERRPDAYALRDQRSLNHELTPYAGRICSPPSMS
jgi:hypothetical protein